MLFDLVVVGTKGAVPGGVRTADDRLDLSTGSRFPRPSPAAILVLFWHPRVRKIFRGLADARGQPQGTPLATNRMFVPGGRENTVHPADESYAHV